MRRSALTFLALAAALTACGTSSPATADTDDGGTMGSTGALTSSGTAPASDATSGASTTAGSTTGGTPSSTSSGADTLADTETQSTGEQAVPWLDHDGPCGNFVVGVNYAWQQFGADFGGIAAWDQLGVRANEDAIRARLEAVRDAGGTVVRWWVFPDFRGDGAQFASDGTATGLSDDALADLEAALRIADEVGIDLMLCLFSFDGYDPDAADLKVGHVVPSMTTLTQDDAKRAALIEHIVTPLAQAVRDSPHAARMVAWDVINEPEWAIEGTNPYGDPVYTPIDRLDPVSHAEMERLLLEIVDALHEVDAEVPVSVGAAAFKWARAWQQLDTDFHQFHMYDWIDTWWPYDNAPSEYGLADKPVLMGEVHFAGLSSAELPELFGAWNGLGYFGGLAWALTDPGRRGEAAGLEQLRQASDGAGCR